MKRTVLITGATGKVGRRLIPLLARRGVTIRAAGRTPPPDRAGIEPVHFDWTDESTYEHARKGVGAVFVVAGRVPQAAHADYVRALVDGASGAGVEQVVLPSTYGVDQAPPENPLRRIEVWQSNHPVCRTPSFGRPRSCRPSPKGLRWRESLLEGIRERDEIAAPGGDGVVAYVSTEDIAAIAAVVLTGDEHGGRAYAPLGPQSLTLTEVAEHISWVAGRQIRYVETDRTPIRDALLGGRVAGHRRAQQPGLCPRLQLRRVGCAQ